MLGATRFVDRHGNEWTLLMDHEAMITAEDVASRNGQNLGIRAVAEGAAAGRTGCLRALVFAALQHHHPDVTIAQATAMVHSEGRELGKALADALKAAAPPAGADEANPPPAPSGTGKRSSAPGAKRGSTRRASSGKPRGASPPR